MARVIASPIPISGFDMTTEPTGTIRSAKRLPELFFGGTLWTVTEGNSPAINGGMASRTRTAGGERCAVTHPLSAERAVRMGNPFNLERRMVKRGSISYVFSVR